MKEFFVAMFTTWSFRSRGVLVVPPCAHFWSREFLVVPREHRELWSKTMSGLGSETKSRGLGARQSREFLGLF